MQKRIIENVSGNCELCSSLNKPEDLYVDQDRNMWRLICPTCFYKMYNGDEKKYFQLTQINCPDMVSYRIFKRHNKDAIVIVNVYPYIKEGGKFFSETEKGDCVANALDRFQSQKVKTKFDLINLQSKSSEQVNPGRGVAFLVAVRATVRFKSYLEYMEHEMYMQFKKDCMSNFDTPVM